MSRNAAIMIVIIATVLIGLCLICVVSIFLNGDQETAYEACVRRCVTRAREANIDRDDITNADYQIIMSEHKNYICPGKCENLR